MLNIVDSIHYWAVASVDLAFARYVKYSGQYTSAGKSTDTAKFARYVKYSGQYTGLNKIELEEPFARYVKYSGQYTILIPS